MSTAFRLASSGELRHVLHTPRIPARDLRVQEPDLGAGQPARAERLALTMKPHTKHPLGLVLRSTEPRPAPLSLTESPEFLEARMPSFHSKLGPLVTRPPGQSGKKGALVSRQGAGAVRTALERQPLPGASGWPGPGRQSSGTCREFGGKQKGRRRSHASPHQAVSASPGDGWPCARQPCPGTSPAEP
jgi:hypothetical protein